MIEARRTVTGKLQGYTASIDGLPLEAYSKRVGGALMLGLRLSESPHRVVKLEPMPIGVDERLAVERLAAHMATDWLTAAVRSASKEAA